MSRFSRKAIKKYTDFHGHGPKGESQVRFPHPGTLICLGDAIEIVYRSDKKNGGGDGKSAEYVHKFAPGAKLMCNESGEKWLYIAGDKIVVKEPGIIN